MGNILLGDCGIDNSSNFNDVEAKIILRVDDAPIVDTLGALVSRFMCGDQVMITSIQKLPAFECMNWRYRTDLSGAWPQDTRFTCPRHCLLVHVISRDRRETQCVLTLGCQKDDTTTATAQAHMDDAVAATAYAAGFNKQMIQGLGNIVDIGSPGESAPSLKVCAPVTCQVLQSSSPEILPRGMTCTMAPYPHQEVQKFVFLGGEDFLEVPQTYFHYAAFASGGNEFVCDIQGAEDENGEIHILDPVVLRTEKTKVEQYITKQWATQAGKTILQQPANCPVVGPSEERFDALHPRCGQLCQSFDPMRKGAKGKKALCGITCLH